MKHHKTSNIESGTSCERYRTPRRPSPHAAFRVSKSTTSKRTASPGLSTSGRPRKRASLPSSYSAQSTLTQIDFVTQTPHATNDGLNYIETPEKSEDTRKAAEPVQQDDGSSEDEERRPPSWTRLSVSELKMNEDHPKRRRKSTTGPQVPQRKSQMPRQSNSKGKRKSTVKQPAKRDKTLTQMNFVRRYITIDDDDDDNDDNDDNDAHLEYIQPAPLKDSVVGSQPSTIVNKGVKLEPSLSSSKRTCRHLEAEIDLSTGESISQSDETRSLKKELHTQDRPHCDVPVTPQKARKLEIPSSQSPESPGLAIITSSQFRSATRSPKRQGRWHLANPEDAIKEEPTGVPGAAEDPPKEKEKVQIPIQDELISRLDQQLPSLDHNTSSTQSRLAEDSRQCPLTDGELPTKRTQRERTVIYETDAETDNDDLEDDFGGGDDTPSRPHPQRQRNCDLAPDRSQSPCDDSQDLPLPSAHTCADPDPEPSSEAPMSEASVFYRRVQPATQFPHEPIPTLNTQRLSELFPNDGSTQYPRQQSAHNSQQNLSPSSQTQTQSQETDQVEIVPESSPVRAHEASVNNDAPLFRRPRPPGSVVQVESSQPVDRGLCGQDGPDRTVSRSQLLTSSLMESVPMPNFWIGSQDSVGELYSLPEK